MTDAYIQFGETLTHVMGQALEAANYTQEDNPTHQTRGLYRYHKALQEDWHCFIEFQSLYHPQSELSYFRVNLIRNSDRVARAQTHVYQEHTLAFIMWHVYEARVLPSDDHWWMYKYPQDLAPQLIEVGKLLFGYGVPWLEGRTDDNG